MIPRAICLKLRTIAGSCFDLADCDDGLGSTELKMKHHKPIIGIVGGIGSGKSTIARLFAELGCLVISSDEQVRRAYDGADVKSTLTRWWGSRIWKADGSIDRRAVAQIVFHDAEQRKRLESLLHPIVAKMRDQMMSESMDDPAVVAFVWDTPLLFETGLASECDAVVFVEAPFELRLARVGESRKWDRAQLEIREKSQWPLDRKQQISDYVVVNTADEAFARGQVREVLSRINRLYP